MISVPVPIHENSDSGIDLPPEEIIFGRSLAMQEIRKCLTSVAGANVSVLLQGQSGTGKEILARYIHNHSMWSGGGFVKLNCPAIPGTLFESELFGYQRGAFTGAYTAKPGLVEMAHRGTLFLDEIAELDPAVQAKLLQVLQDGQFCRIGAQTERRIEVRIVCATNRNLEREIQLGSFRQDLFFRINVVNVQLPSLKDRKEDIPALVDYFLKRYTATYRRPATPPSQFFMTFLEKYEWPGNIRELENAVKRLVILGSEEPALQSLENAKPKVLADECFEIPEGPLPLKQITRDAVKQIEKKVILRTLEAHRWNRRMVSRALGISYAALLYKMRQAGVPARQAKTRKQMEATVA